MKLRFLTGAIALTFCAAFLGCESDDKTQTALGSYDNGVLILNEGGVGEVSYLSNDLSVMQHNIFSTVNGTVQNLGIYVQSVFFDGDRAFIISNGSNKITVVDRNTFEYITTISTGFSVPRYGTVLNGKAYVTNLDSFATNSDDFVSVIDLSSLTVVDQIAINDYADRIVAANGKVYVANGSFGMGDKISVIDPGANSVSLVINVGLSPNSFEARGGTLYVLCGSFTDASKLVKIDLETNVIVGENVFPATMGNAGNLDIEGDKVYFTAGGKIYAVATNANQVTDSPIIDTQSTSFYMGYGFAVNGGRIYISEAAADFSSDGKLFIYSTEGEFIAEKATGMGPNGFYFN